MTKRERAIIMAYTGGVTFAGDDIGYFLEYVKEKTGIELDVVGWSDDIPIISFGSNEKEVEETVDKIRSACKEDFDDLIRSSDEESEEKNAERFAKKAVALEKRLGRCLRLDEAMLLVEFDRIDVDEKEETPKIDSILESMNRCSRGIRWKPFETIDEEKRPKMRDIHKPEPENKRVFKKTSECDTCRNFSKLFNKPEDMYKCMHVCTEQAHAQFKNDRNAKIKPEPDPTTTSFEMDITRKLLEIFLGRKLNPEEVLTLILLDLNGELKKDELKKESEEVLKHMCECCCTKKEDKK